MSLIRVKQIDNEELNSFVNVSINTATGELYNIIESQSGVQSINNQSGVLNLIGGSGVNVYNNGNNFYFTYTGAIGTGGSSSGLNVNDLNNYLNTGNFNLKDTVRTTGTQNISGIKSFISSQSLDNLAVTNFYATGADLVGNMSWIRVGVNTSSSACFGYRKFTTDSRAIIKLANIYTPLIEIDGKTDIYTQVNTFFETPIINLSGKYLYSNWSTINPIQTGHIANKKYVDEQITGLSGTLSKYPSTISDITLNNYVFTSSDVGKTISISGNNSITGLIPSVALQNFKTGDSISILQYGTGQLTISGSGCSLVSRGSAYKLAGQYAMAEILYKSYNNWILYGDITT